ncbi:MAG: hypothetical protein GY754_00440 [bacterium]|nr:hypothetical protein [bacterium]
MISRCNGMNCPLSDTCYRHILSEGLRDDTWFQALYSPIHHDCRNYWPVREPEDHSAEEAHAALLSSMISRLK